MTGRDSQEKIDAQAIANSHDDDDWEPIAADDPRALVPVGNYQVLCTRAVHRSYPIYHRHAIVLTLRICEDPFMGVVVERYYNVPSDRKILRGSDYFREWILASQGVKPHRRERMHKKKFVGKLFLANLVTVTTNRHGVNVGAAAYSKAERLIELLATNDGVKSP
jgi:hypothetical protein